MGKLSLLSWAFDFAQATQIKMSLLLCRMVNLGLSAGLKAVEGWSEVLQPALLHWLGRSIKASLK